MRAGFFELKRVLLFASALVLSAACGRNGPPPTGGAAPQNGSGEAIRDARFSSPYGVAVDATGNVYVADTGNNRICKIPREGSMMILAGNGNAGDVDGTGGGAGTAEFHEPRGVAVDNAGNVYVADDYNNRIRKIDSAGNVTTWAGTGADGFTDGTGPRAQFSSPSGVAVDTAGNVYVADYDNNAIRKIDSSGDTTTVAGNGTYGFVDGTGGSKGTAEFGNPTGVAVDKLGNLYVADRDNNRVRKIDVAGRVTTLAGNGVSGDADGTGGPSGTAQFDSPTAVAVDASGNVYAADENNEIRKIDTFGNVVTLATGFNNPWGVAVDASGAVYVADTDNQDIRVVR